MTRMIQSLVGKKHYFGGFNPEETYWISVDTVNFQTQEFWLVPLLDWFDYKIRSSGLNYEFACALRHPKLALARGPEPAEVKGDSTIFMEGNKDKKPENYTQSSLRYF